jgi:hypothetical protein
MNRFIGVISHSAVGVSAALGVAILLSIVPQANAAVPTKTYEQWQRAAPEALMIEVVKVKTESFRVRESTKTAIVITANVRSIERSQTQVQEGMPITITYTNTMNDNPVPGERAVPLLAPGKVYLAYLSQREAGRPYVPAAGASSFIMRQMQVPTGEN